MARCSISSSGSLRTRLSSCATYLEAVEELRLKLLHSSPSYLISSPEKLISLIEVAKSTLKNKGVSLHTFSSCPESLVAHKAAYFGFLIQLQAHSHCARLGSRDLQARLNRLLFPLSTRLKVCTKSGVNNEHGNQVPSMQRAGGNYGHDSSEVRSSSLSSMPSSGGSPSSIHPISPYEAHPSSLSIIPPNVMLPPPLPMLRTSRQEKLLVSIPARPPSRQNTGFLKPLDRGRHTAPRRKPSHDTLHFKRRHAEPTPLHKYHSTTIPDPFPYKNDASSKLLDSFPRIAASGDDSGEVSTDKDSGSDSSSEDSDVDSDDSPVVVPARSPLRRSFGIFCTGKGRGAFSGSVQMQQRGSRPVQIEPNEDSMDSED